MEQTAKSEKSVEPEPVSEKPQVTLTTEEPQLDVNSEEQQVAVAPNEPHIDVTAKESQVAVIPSIQESPVAVVSDKPQMDVTQNQQQDSGIPTEVKTKKCVVAPEKRHQAAKALNIKKITGSVYQQPRKGHRLCMLWRTGSQLPVIPEEPELDVIVENISTHDPEPSNTPQQAPISKATNPAEAFFSRPG
ncbi:hypothetical protein GBF38_014826 [Nibea albiflora]|uniref:Uncharacterized protein n=1 Tax=Nibea albiflora TaxID=240163 RepID=A0ACB7EJY0_NIBAL|nr:hypothetical protein GBF38_014826 [Nibea albiflora]